MNSATPTVDEQDLAYKIAKRIDDAEYRQKIQSSSKLLRLKGLSSIVLDEIMQFHRQQMSMPEKDERQEELW